MLLHSPILLSVNRNLPSIEIEGKNRVKQPECTPPGSGAKEKHHSYRGQGNKNQREFV